MRDVSEDEEMQFESPGGQAETGIERSEALDQGNDHFPSDELPLSAQGASNGHFQQQTLDSYFCERCRKQLPVHNRAEHDDWHFAKELAKEMQEEQRSSSDLPRPSHQMSKPAPGRGRGRPSGGGGSGRPAVAEKGQKKLAFGKG